MFALIQSSKFWLLLAATSLPMLVPVWELDPDALVLLEVLLEPVELLLVLVVLVLVWLTVPVVVWLVVVFSLVDWWVVLLPVWSVFWLVTVCWFPD